MPNLKKAILNERDDDYRSFEPTHEALDTIEKQLRVVASKAVEEAMLDDDSAAYLGIHPKFGDGIYLTVFVDKYVLYFDADELFDASFSDRNELEAMAEWHKSSYELIQSVLKGGRHGI